MAAHEFPDEETLAKYLALLRRVMIATRYAEQPLVAELMDAAHNLPDLLARWSDMNEDWVVADFEEIERKHPELAGWFTTILQGGN